MEHSNTHGLDLHCQLILEEYRDMQPVFATMKEVVLTELQKCLSRFNILVTAVEARIKSEDSLVGKLQLKGHKYRTLGDLTDIMGARIITFYSDEVDKIAALMEDLFEIDRENSVDKRKMHELNSFGYMSLHYICRIPRKLYHDPAHPEINEYRFELQMRTALQHVWANINHDTGYKSGVEVPVEHLRNLTRLAGMLELADDEFSRIRRQITDYRRRVQTLVSSGNFDEVGLNGDTFRSYLAIHPFERLTNRIAAINQAEVMQDAPLGYLKVLQGLGFKTLGDVEKLKHDYSEAAYQLALHQLGGTDLDIISSSLALQDLCIAYLIQNGYGEKDLAQFFEAIQGPGPYNQARAQRIIQLAAELQWPTQQQNHG
ncbi:MAG: hypothetical protein MJ058_02135 [Akkermansia sp.]|nr:hypothetical protein [Akkermansia sp.]